MEQEAKFEQEISVADKHTALMQRLSQNYFSYREKLMTQDKEALIEKAAEIAAVQEAYSYLTTRFEFEKEALDDLLGLDDPLKYFADRWPVPVSEVFDVDQDIREQIAEIRESQEYLYQKEQPASVRERLQRAVREVKDRPASESPTHDVGER